MSWEQVAMVPILIVVLGLVLWTAASCVTMFPMTWNKQPDEDIWTSDIPEFDGIAVITVTVPHEAEVHFGRGDDLHIQSVGSFLRWDDAARMVERYIAGLREVAS